MSIQNCSTDFPLLAFGIYLIEFQCVQTADADIRTGRSLDRFGGLETQSDLIIFPGGGIIQVVGNDRNIQKFRYRRVNADKSGIGRVIHNNPKVSCFVLKNNIEKNRI